MSKNIHDLVNSIDMHVEVFDKFAQIPAGALPQRSPPFQFPMSQTELESWTLPPQQPKPQTTTTKPTGEAAAPQAQTPAPTQQPAKPAPANKKAPTAFPAKPLPQRTEFKFPKAPEEVPEPGEPIGAKKSSRARSFLLHKFSKKYDR